MRTRREPPFAKGWFVVEHEVRIAGEWKDRKRFDPGEWMVCFWPYGKYTETVGGLRFTGSKWTFDTATGIISLVHEPSFVEKRVFRETDEGIYLYYYEDQPHIRPDRDVIIEHHAHERLRLVKPPIARLQ